jgi:cytoskeletal protein CcmA (bactofilin family)
LNVRDANKRRGGDASNGLTIIGPGTTLTGEIRSQGSIRVEGQVSGRIHSEDAIIIQETGQVKADLIAREIVISGHVDGNVFANERLEITDKGKLIGNITAPRVSISEGVVFEGKCTMKAPGDLKAAAASRPDSAGPAVPKTPATETGL